MTVSGGLARIWRELLVFDGGARRLHAKVAGIRIELKNLLGAKSARDGIVDRGDADVQELDQKNHGGIDFVANARESQVALAEAETRLTEVS